MTRRWREATYRPGRRWTAGRLPAVGYVASVGVLALAGTAAGVGIGAVLTESTSVDRTYQTLAALSDLRRQLADAQRGEQAFVLTADEHYLEPYTTAAAQVPPTLGELRVLIGAAHRRTIDDLQASADATIEYYGQAVTLLRTDGFTTARPAAYGTVGTETAARAQQLISDLHRDQTALLHAQRQRVADRAAHAVFFVVAAVVAAAALVTLSARRARAVAAPASSERPDATWHEPLRVLLAEDDEVNQQVAQFMLGKLGHHVDTVANGRDAVQAMRAADYDVVLMDVRMPVLDGLEATRLIRSELPPGRQPHIIAMTAGVLAEDRAACRAAGMNDYLAKPVRLAELTSALTPLLRTSPGGPARDGADDRDAAVRARMAEISDGEPRGPERTLIGAMLTSFTARTPAGLDRLARLITAGDVSGVRSQAQALTGSATDVGATRLARLLAGVEADARTGRLPRSPATMAAIRAEYDTTAPGFERLAGELTAVSR
ncbi:response regulator [Actinoplanes sp. NPDC048988]|uniref:response regulator n=1 Tax=Actinoplanes sp. NPDC048988 TaxID=3363901 RepID=UPI003712A188